MTVSELLEYGCKAFMARTPFGFLQTSSQKINSNDINGGCGLADADWRTRTGGRGLADADSRTRAGGLWEKIFPIY
jgi:hypothetical protein